MTLEILYFFNEMIVSLESFGKFGLIYRSLLLFFLEEIFRWERFAKKTEVDFLLGPWEPSDMTGNKLVKLAKFTLWKNEVRRTWIHNGWTVKLKNLVGLLGGSNWVLFSINFNVENFLTGIIGSFNHNLFPWKRFVLFCQSLRHLCLMKKIELNVGVSSELWQKKL